MTPAAQERLIAVALELARLADAHPKGHDTNKFGVSLRLCRDARFALCLADQRPDPAEFEVVIDHAVAEVLDAARYPAPGVAGA